MAGVLKHRIALAVPNQIRLRFANRQRRRSPCCARIFVAKINDFAGWIANRIVGPRRQTVLVTVDRPGKSRAGFRNQESEVRLVRDYVRPWRRGPLAFAQHGDVFASSMSETADTIKEGKLWRL